MSLTPGEIKYPRNNSHLNNYDNNITLTITKKSINERFLASNKSTNKPILNVQKNTSNNRNSQHFTNNNNCNKPAINSKSFAEATAIFNFPNMNQAIILFIIEGIKQIDYVITIIKLIGPLI